MKPKETKVVGKSIGLIIFFIYILFSIHPAAGAVGVIVVVVILKNLIKKNPDLLKLNSTNYQKLFSGLLNIPTKNTVTTETEDAIETTEKNQHLDLLKTFLPTTFNQPRLQKRKKYLQIALNSTLAESLEIIRQLPHSDRILIEAGTPLIKIYGTDGITKLRAAVPAGTYVVADNKCADLAEREVEMMSQAGANGTTCLGVAPIETINSFIEACEKYNLDSMIDMMNVSDPLAVLKKLKKIPSVVILHRGVDEAEFSKEKQLPLYQIKQIKGSYDVLVAVAGGDTTKEIQRAIFNDADIVVVWKNFYQSSADTTQLASDFLKEIK